MAGAASLGLLLAACGGSPSAGNSSSVLSSQVGAVSNAIAPTSSDTSSSSADSTMASGSDSAMASSSDSAMASGSDSAMASGSDSAMASGSDSAMASGSATDGGSGCPSSAAADTFTFSADGDVNVQNLWQKTLLPAFKTACPQFTVNLTFDSHSTNANLNVSKIAAAQKAGQAPPFDVASESVAASAAQAGLTETLTAADIPELKNVNQQAVAAYNNAAAPYRGSGVLLAYDSTKITDPPKTLKDLLAYIKANPGQFTYNDPATGGSGMSFAETVADSFMTPEDLKTVQVGYHPELETKWAKGFAALKELNSSVYQKVYPKGNQAVLDLLNKGEISLAPVWSDQFLSAKASGQLGQEYKVAQIADPPFTGGASYFAVIKGTKHAAGAKALIDWTLRPAQQATIVKTIAGFPAVPMSTLPADVQNAFGNVNTQDLRLGMSGKMGADFSSKWAANVPG